MLMAALLGPTAACAQWSGRLELLSDHRFRGVSQSHRHPVWQLSVNHDWDGGAYIGGMVSATPLLPEASSLALQMDVGYARRLSPSICGDAGVVFYRFMHAASQTPDSYTEYFAALSGEKWSARFHVGPGQPGHEAPIAYAEVNAAMPLTPRVVLTGHAGVFHQMGRPGRHSDYDSTDSTPPLTRWDVSTGIAVQWSQLDWGLSLVATLPANAPCEPSAGACNTTALMSVSRAF